MSSVKSLFLFCYCIFSITFVSSWKHILLDGTYEFVNLALPLDNRTVSYTQGNEGSKGSSDEVLSLSQGYCTDIKAPSNYQEHGARIGDISTEKLIVQIIFLDISPKVNNDSNYILRMKDVYPLLGDLLRHMSEWPSLLVFKFGWSKYYFEEQKKYRGYDEAKGTYNFPGINEEVAHWIMTNESCKQVVGIGVDLPPTELQTNESVSFHKTLAKAGLYVIKGMNLNSTLPDHQCTAVALPLRIQDGNSAPLNIVALCSKKYLYNNADLGQNNDKDDGNKEKQLTNSHHTCSHSHHMHNMSSHDIEEHGSENEHNMNKHLQHPDNKETSHNGQTTETQQNKQENANPEIHSKSQNKTESNSYVGKPQKFVDELNKIKDKLKY